MKELGAMPRKFLATGRTRWWIAFTIAGGCAEGQR